MDGYIHRLEFDLKMSLEADESDARYQADNCYDTYIGPVIDQVITKYSQRYTIDIDSIEIDLGHIDKEEIPFVLRIKLEEELDKRITNTTPEEHQTYDYNPESRVSYANLPPIPLQEISSEAANKSKEAGIIVDNGTTLPDSKSSLFKNGLRHSEIAVYGNKDYHSSPKVLTSITGTSESSQDNSGEPFSAEYPDISQDSIIASGKGVETRLENGTFLYSSEFSDPVDIILNYVINEAIPWSIPAEDFHPEELVQFYLSILISNGPFIVSLFQDGERLVRFLDLLSPEDFKSFCSLIPSYSKNELIHPEIILESQPYHIYREKKGDRESGSEDEEEREGFEINIAVSKKETATDNIVLSEKDNQAEADVLVETISAMYEDLSKGLTPVLIDSSLSDTSTVTIPEKFSTSSSGLVLFHPFLVSFFQKLSLLGPDRQFKDKQAIIEAVHTLHHIADPHSKHHSHSLHLEKILCGLSPDSFIPRRWKVNAKTEEEIKALMDAVCEYWEPLNRTSAEGFRNSFIRREGLLGIEDDTWVLYVEHLAIDILLSQMPWEISTILLPWSKRILLVDWQANF